MFFFKPCTEHQSIILKTFKKITRRSNQFCYRKLISKENSEYFFFFFLSYNTDLLRPIDTKIQIVYLDITIPERLHSLSTDKHQVTWKLIEAYVTYYKKNCN